jgi:hypothetical protein
VVGVFIAPTTKPVVGEAVCRWAHRTVRCATEQCPVRQPRHPTVRVLTISTVGALTSRGHRTVRCRTGHALFTIRCAFWRCSDSAHCSRCRRPLEWTVALVSRCSAGTPDSPVDHSGAALQKPEGEEFESIAPGAPDTVRWHTGQSGAPDQGFLRFLLLLSFEP